MKPLLLWFIPFNSPTCHDLLNLMLLSKLLWSRKAKPVLWRPRKQRPQPPRRHEKERRRCLSESLKRSVGVVCFIQTSVTFFSSPSPLLLSNSFPDPLVCMNSRTPIPASNWGLLNEAHNITAMMKMLLKKSSGGCVRRREASAKVLTSTPGCKKSWWTK